MLVEGSYLTYIPVFENSEKNILILKLFPQMKFWGQNKKKWKIETAIL